MFGENTEEIVLKKIVLIVCYYGKFPPYFPLWLDSCAMNNMLDFLLITDINTSTYQIPQNVHIKVESFQELKNRFQKLFPFEIKLNMPYKLCDYRPVYGLAFQEELKAFDFWGYCDIDLIFGNVSKFLTDDILCNYDKLFEYGHFMLFRNTDFMRNLFRRKGANFPYAEVFQHDECFAFDEMFGMNKIAKENGVSTFQKKYCKDIPYTMYGIISGQQNIREEIYYKDKNAIYGAVLSGGEIIKKEYMYIHFQKKIVTPRFNSDNIPESYYISVNRCDARTVSKEPFIEEILEYTDYDPSISKSRLKVQWKMQRIKRVLCNGNKLSRRIYIKNSVELLKRKIGL